MISDRLYWISLLLEKYTRALINSFYNPKTTTHSKPTKQKGNIILCQTDEQLRFFGKFLVFSIATADTGDCCSRMDAPGKNSKPELWMPFLPSPAAIAQAMGCSSSWAAAELLHPNHSCTFILALKPTLFLQQRISFKILKGLWVHAKRGLILKFIWGPGIFMSRKTGTRRFEMSLQQL